MSRKCEGHVCVRKVKSLVSWLGSRDALLLGKGALCWLLRLCRFLQGIQLLSKKDGLRALGGPMFLYLFLTPRAECVLVRE